MQDTAEHLAPIQELLRIPAPCPGALGLAADGTNLWVASNDVGRIYGIDAAQGTVFEENPSIGEPIGMCVTGDALRVVTSEEGDEDNRYIRRYIMGKGFKDQERFRCPDDTGSFLAYDGDILYLSQRGTKSICVLTPEVTCERTIPLDIALYGFCVIDGLFWTIASRGKAEPGVNRLRTIDARGATPIVTDHASIPFGVRSLAYDGTRLWVVDRDTNELVALALPQ